SISTAPAGAERPFPTATTFPLATTMSAFSRIPCGPSVQIAAPRTMTAEGDARAPASRSGKGRGPPWEARRAPLRPPATPLPPALSAAGGGEGVAAAGAFGTAPLGQLDPLSVDPDLGDPAPLRERLTRLDGEVGDHAGFDRPEPVGESELPRRRGGHRGQGVL